MIHICPNNSNWYDNFPMIWLLDRSKWVSWEDILENHSLGMVFEMPILLRVIEVSSLWTWSYTGNLGPMRQLSSSRYLSLNVGTQTYVTLKTRDWFVAVVSINSSSLVRFISWASVITPFQEFSWRFKLINSESCPILVGMIPSILLKESSNCCKDDKVPIEAGIEPQIELYWRLRYLKFPSLLNESGMFPSS